MVMFVIGLILLVLSFFIGGIVKVAMDDETEKGGYVVGKYARILSLILIVVGTATATIVTVPTGYSAVLMRFGAVSGTLDPGIHMIMPYANSYELMETRTQKENADCASSSKDLQSVRATIAINYHIDSEGIAPLYTKVGLDFKNRIIDPAAQESLKQVTAQYTAEDLIKKRSVVKSEVELEITDRLKAYRIVVEKNGVSITNFDFSTEFNTAIEQKQVAQQSAEKQKYILQQAELEKETAIVKAKGESEASRIRAIALKSSGGGRVLAEQWIAKWNGALPVVGDSKGMMINIADLMKQSNQEPAQ